MPDFTTRPRRQWSGARPRTNERAKESVTAAAAAAAAAAAGAIGCSFVRSFSSSEFVLPVGLSGKCKVSWNRCFGAATPPSEKSPAEG